MGRGQRAKMMTETYGDSLVGLSEASTPPCSNEECASLRQSTAILSRMFADLSSQAEICQQTKLERDTFRNLVEEKEKYIAVLTADKRQLEHEINALKLEKQRIESKHGDLQASISSLQQRADLAETCEARANQFEQKLEEQSVELRMANEKRRLVAEKYKETVLLAKTHMEAAERDAKKVVKLQDQVKALHNQITLLKAKPHSSPHLIKFAEDCCELLVVNGLMTPKLSARLKRMQSGSLTSTSIGSDDADDDDELAAHLEQLVADGDQPMEQQRQQQISKEPPKKKAKMAGGRVKSSKAPSADMVAMVHAGDRKRRYEAVTPREAPKVEEESGPSKVVEEEEPVKCSCDGPLKRLFSSQLLTELGDKLSPVILERFDSVKAADLTDAAKRSEAPSTSGASSEATGAAKVKESATIPPPVERKVSVREEKPTSAAAPIKPTAATSRTEQPIPSTAPIEATVSTKEPVKPAKITAPKHLEEPKIPTAPTHTAVSPKKSEEPLSTSMESSFEVEDEKLTIHVEEEDEPTTSAAVDATDSLDAVESVDMVEEPTTSASLAESTVSPKEAAEPIVFDAPTEEISSPKRVQRRTSAAAKKVEESATVTAPIESTVSARKTERRPAATAKKAEESTATTMAETIVPAKKVERRTRAAAKKTEEPSTSTLPAAAPTDAAGAVKKATEVQAPTTNTAPIDVKSASKKAEIAARAAMTRASTRQRTHRLQPPADVQLVALGPATNRPQIASLTKHKPAIFTPPPKLRQQQAKMEHNSEVILTGVLDKAIGGHPVEAVVLEITTRLDKVTTTELATGICKYIGHLDSGDLWPGLVNLPASQRINYPYLSVKEKHLFTLIDQLTCEQQWRDLLWQFGQSMLLDTVRRKDPTPAQFGRDVRCSAMCLFLARDNPQAAPAFRSLLEHVISRTSSELAVPAVCFLAVVWPFRFGPLFAEDDSLLFRRLFVVQLAVSTPRNKRTAQSVLDRVCEQKTATLLPAEPKDSVAEWLQPMIANLRSVTDALVLHRASTTAAVTVRPSKLAGDMERAILSIWTLATSVKHLPLERKANLLTHLIMENEHWCELLMETSAVGSVVQRSVMLALSGRMVALAVGQVHSVELSRLLESAVNARRRLLSIDAATRVDSDEIALFGLNEFIGVVGSLTQSLE